MLKALVSSLAFATIAESVAAAPANAPNVAALDRLVAASNAVCVAPLDYGYSIDGKAQASAQGTVPKLLAKLFSFGLSATVGAGGEFHKGIAQRDVGAASTARNTCAENVFVHLVDHYSFTDLSTGSSLKPPLHPLTVYRARAAPVAASGGQSIGSQISVSGNANNTVTAGAGSTVNITTGSGSAAFDHKDQLIAIAQLVKEANSIEAQFAATNDPEAIKAQYGDWYNRADAYLTAQFDPSYSAQFEAAVGDAMGLTDHSIVGNGYWATIRAKNEILATMLTELRRTAN